LGRKQWLLIAVPLVITLLIAVLVPAVYFSSRNRKPVDYSDTLAEATAAYSVTYDSGDGLTDNCTLTWKVLEAGVREDSQICFHAVTVYDPFPSRRVDTLFGVTKMKLGSDETWRNAADLQVVKTMSLQIDVPFVNTVQTTITYSNYSGYPGWPYHLGDRWTYDVSRKADVSLQPSWTETFQAEVVSDNAVVQVGGSQYQCFKVVHTLVATTNERPSGSGVGGTITEYWYTGGKSIGPIKIENALSFKGTEIQTFTGDGPLPLF
jgi:hypothetical protein